MKIFPAMLLEECLQMSIDINIFCQHLDGKTMLIKSSLWGPLTLI